MIEIRPLSTAAKTFSIAQPHPVGPAVVLTASESDSPAGGRWHDRAPCGTGSRDHLSVDPSATGKLNGVPFLARSPWPRSSTDCLCQRCAAPSATTAAAFAPRPWSSVKVTSSQGRICGKSCRPTATSMTLPNMSEAISLPRHAGAATQRDAWAVVDCGRAQRREPHPITGFMGCRSESERIHMTDRRGVRAPRRP